MKKKVILPFVIAPFLLSIPGVHAHCPLCTMGAAAAAGAAVYLGVNQAIIGVFVGAFAVSMGWMFANMLRWKIPFKKAIFIAVSFATTVLPMLAVMKGITAIPVFIAGQYGSLLNSTYIINLFIPGSILGGLTVMAAPYLSRKVSEMRSGKMIPYQGLAITFSLLFMLSIMIQVFVRSY